MRRFALLCVGFMTMSCAPLPPIPFVTDADLAAPVVTGLRLASPVELEVEFDEPVRVVSGPLGSESVGDVTLRAAEGPSSAIGFRFADAPSPEREHHVEAQVADGAGRFPQVAGLKYTWDPEAEPGNRILSVEVQGEDGAWAPIDPAAVYGVVSNNYMRAGGDGYSVFASEGMNAYDYGPGLEVVVADYLAETAPYAPYLDGRISTAE